MNKYNYHQTSRCTMSVLVANVHMGNRVSSAVVYVSQPQKDALSMQQIT